MGLQGQGSGRIRSGFPLCDFIQDIKNKGIHVYTHTRTYARTYMYTYVRVFVFS